MKKVTAVFDIGKTNKKFFLFDSQYQEIYREYTRFDEIVDEDGYPTEDLDALQNWLRNLFNKILQSMDYDVTAINFSTYGASLVHIDENGMPLTPLYNYTKPLNKALIQSFYEKYGPEKEFSKRTGSLNSGMLNSGMQLFWLKYDKPEVFKEIKYSLHLPQYLSYIFTGIPLSEYTSIGCHTALWDYEKRDYHQWVYDENIHKILPPIVSTETGIIMNYYGKSIKIGVGIHDSSSALLPYLRSLTEPFILVSTGTWSITLNPFTDGALSSVNIDEGCINYMRINGQPVKSSRIFLGNEYKLQTKMLADKYGVSADYHKKVRFDHNIYQGISHNFRPLFEWISLPAKGYGKVGEINYSTFEEAYHHLMMELVLLQIKSIRSALGNNKIEKLFIDGGFSDNDIYLNLLSHYLEDMELRTTDASLGSALGAAISVSGTRLHSAFLKENYALKKHLPFIIK